MGIVLVLKCFNAKVTVVRPALITALVLTILVGGAGVGRIVAAYNTEAYISGKLKTIDVNTIGECGDVSITQLIKLEKHLKGEENFTTYNQVMDELIDKFYDSYAFKPSGKIVRKENTKIENYNLEVNSSEQDFDEFIEEDPEFVQKALWCKSAENLTSFYDNAVYLEYKNMLDYGLADPIEPPEFATKRK